MEPALPQWLQPGQYVRWRDPCQAHAIGWDDLFGPGPFEVVRLLDKRPLDIPAAVILMTRRGEWEINAVWLAPADGP